MASVNNDYDDAATRRDALEVSTIELTMHGTPLRLRFRMLACIVCGYAFSDIHHHFPRARYDGHGPVIPLCPNHHRYASMIQSMNDEGVPPTSIREFADRYFDAAFNEIILETIVRQPEDEAMVHRTTPVDSIRDLLKVLVIRRRA